MSNIQIKQARWFLRLHQQIETGSSQTPTSEKHVFCIEKVMDNCLASIVTQYFACNPKPKP